MGVFTCGFHHHTVFLQEKTENESARCNLLCNCGFRSVEILILCSTGSKTAKITRFLHIQNWQQIFFSSALGLPSAQEITLPGSPGFYT